MWSPWAKNKTRLDANSPCFRRRHWHDSRQRSLSSIYLHGSESVHSIPLGTLYEDVGSNVFVPLGSAISPPVPPEILRQLARADPTHRLFVTGGTYPITAVPESAFVAATRLLIADVPVVEDTPIAPPLDAERPASPTCGRRRPECLRGSHRRVRGECFPRRGPTCLSSSLPMPPSRRPKRTGRRLPLAWSTARAEMAHVASGGPTDRFLRSFVLPLVAGGRLEVRGLIGPGVLQGLTGTDHPDATLLSDIAKHVHAHLAHIGPVAFVELISARRPRP